MRFVCKSGNEILGRGAWWCTGSEVNKSAGARLAAAKARARYRSASGKF